MPQNIIDRFDCTFDGEPVLSWRLDAATSRDPFIEFSFRPSGPGELPMV